jgi:hypothetical protein
MPLSSIRRGDKAADADGPVLRFRNYTPKSEGLQGLQVPKPEMPNVEEQVTHSNRDSRRRSLCESGSSARRILLVHKRTSALSIQPPTPLWQVGSAAIVHSDPTQEPLLNLAPKKVNWDLKRDMEPQMKKLRAMTDRAIIQIIRECVPSHTPPARSQRAPCLPL